jgi:acyl-CoA synthetase (NDP forming)
MNNVPLDLNPFFQPSSIAIVGASQDFTTIGGKPVRNLLAHGYQGKLYLVNPRYSEINGLACYPSIDAIPDEIDHVLIAVSKKHITGTIEQCIQKKAKFITIFGAGYAEVGEEGAELQQQLVELCRSHGIRFCGPNCIGSINVKQSLPMGFSNSFEKESFISGNIGLVSQSGALGYATFALGQEEGLGFSYVANTGNQADLNTLDFLEFLVSNPDTKVVSGYMEAVPDGQRLKKIALDAIQEQKPLVIFKSGRSDLGKMAAMSHTGSLAGSEQAFQAVAKQYGITLVKDTDDLIDSLKIFSRGKTASGNRVAVISTSGATGIMMADNCAELGLEMAVLSEDTRKKIKNILPDFASSLNPVDVTAQALNDKDIFRRCLDILIMAPEVDSLVVTTTFAGALVLKMMEEVIKADESSDKPILVSLTGPEDLVGSARRRLYEVGVPTYGSVARTTASLKKLVDYSDFLRKKTLLVHEEAANTIPQDDIQLKKHMTEYDVKALLRKWGIPVPQGGMAATEEEVRLLADTLSFPIAAKVVSKEITHKSDIGGVVLHINDAEGAVQAMKQIFKNVNEKIPGAEAEGILLEEMAPSPFLEAIVGVKRDPQFGPMIMCGLGGIYVEVLKDVSLRNAPVSPMEALEMIRELKAYPLFKGARGGAEYDVEAFADALVKISHLAVMLDDLEEMDINPLIIRPKGQGVLALDGLLIK